MINFCDSVLHDQVLLKPWHYSTICKFFNFHFQVSDFVFMCILENAVIVLTITNYDVCQYCLQGECCPHAFSRIDKTLNKGLVSLVLFLYNRSKMLSLLVAVLL